MNNNIWHPKQKPISSLASLSGGAGGMMYGGVDQDYSVEFDGSNDRLLIDITDSSMDFADDGAFTFECFIYLDSLQNGSNGYQSIAGRWEGTGSHYCWLTDIEPNGKWTWYYSDTGGSSIYSFATPTGTISAQTWHHIACVKNGSSGRLLVDGSQAAYKSDFNKGNSDSTQDLCIGDNIDNFTSPWDGKISNLRWTTGQALYGSTYGVPTEPLTTTSQGATASNVKILCCNEDTPTGSTKTNGTITNPNGATTSTDNPF